MGSRTIDRAAHPGKTDALIAEEIAKKHGFVAVVRYKNSRDAPNFTDFGMCETDEEVRQYLHSPHCHGAELVYDARATSLAITRSLVLSGRCRSCRRRADRRSLELQSGNDFYICPRCSSMFCEGCYVGLPLTDYPAGYGMCPDCRVPVKRALPGHYGEPAEHSSQLKPHTPASSRTNRTQPRRPWWRFW